MEHHAGIDVSLEHATGRIVREAKVASEPAALVGFFRQLGVLLTRIGLEAGPLSPRRGSRGAARDPAGHGGTVRPGGQAGSLWTALDGQVSKSAAAADGTQ
jgi:hypothetical protein